MYNTIVTAGYLVTDPELKDVKGDSKVCKMRLCISNDRAKTPCYIDAELWNKQAEIASEYLSKGRRIILQGELCQSSWEKDGKTLYKYFIRGESFTFINDGKKEEDKKEVAAVGADEDVPF